MICIDCNQEIPDEMARVGALSISPGDSLLICSTCIAKYARSIEVDIRFDTYRQNRSPENEGGGGTNNEGKE